MKPLSENQRRCLIEATIDPMVPFPRGFARSKAGPFFDVRTVQSLVRAGVLRLVRTQGGGKHRIQVTARAA